jgi:hypothetical protein
MEGEYRESELGGVMSASGWGTSSHCPSSTDSEANVCKLASASVDLALNLKLVDFWAIAKEMS